MFYFNIACTGSFSEKLKFELRLNEDKEQALKDLITAFQAEGTGGAKAPRQEAGWLGMFKDRWNHSK